MRFLNLTILSCLFLSCTPPTQFITRDYSGKRLQAESLAICVDQNRIIINNPEDVADDLGDGAASDAFYRFFDTTATRAVSNFSTIKKARMMAYPDRSQLIETTFTLGTNGGNISMKAPTEGTKLAFGEEMPPYILLIDLLQIHRDPGAPATMMPGPNGQMTMSGGRAAALVINFQYVLWDNSNSRTIAYGKAVTTAPLLFAMTRATWQSGTTEVVRRIMRKSPFDLPPVAGY